ncbi:MAG: M20 family metallopeptidase [Acidobacteriota bacterium]
MKSAEILNYFNQRRDETIETIRQIVEIESPSYDVGQSKLVASWIENEAHKLSLDLQIERVPAEKYGDHVLIRAFPEVEKNILLLGHTDTVHPIGTKLLNPTRIEDGKFFGCGIFDMKSGIVLMFEALRFIADSVATPSRSVTILLSCDEEVGSFSGRALVEREARKAEACFVFEPSANGRVKTGRKGTGMFTLNVHGVPAHAGLEPEKGASAILELARQIESLHELNDPSAGTTVNVCTARGGTTINVIPEHAECTVDVRFTSMEEAARIENSVRELKPFDDQVRLEITGGVNRPPMERTPAVVALFENARSLAADFGYELGETQVGGASDGNFVAALGVPLLDGLGVAGDGAHRLDEHILIDDIAKRSALVTSMLVSR